MKRTLAAVGVGYLVINTMTMASFVVLNATVANLNSPGWLSIKLLIAIVGGLCGGYGAGVVARSALRRAIAMLAVLMTVLSIVAIIIMFGTEPLWFQAALIGGTAPAIIAGGYARTRQGRTLAG